MLENEKFDIFIAYYGNENTGSERYARELYEHIKKYEIFPGKKIHPYFHPLTNPYGKFEETPSIVARTPMFILVVDKGIRNVFSSQIARYRSDAVFSYLYDEVSAFHGSDMYKLYGGDEASRLLITDNFEFKDAESLHPIFAGKTISTTKEDVVNWIKRFYNTKYLERHYLQYKSMAEKNIHEFTKGMWVANAEELFRYTCDEKIGRTLILYYAKRADLGNRDAVEQMRRIYNTMIQRNHGIDLSENTKLMLKKINDKYL